MRSRGRWSPADLEWEYRAVLLGIVGAASSGGALTRWARVLEGAVAVELKALCRLM
jgi:hypothetical protein